MLASTLWWLYLKWLKVQHGIQFITFSTQFLTVVLKQDVIFTRVFFLPPECSFPFPFPRASSVALFTPPHSRGNNCNIYFSASHHCFYWSGDSALWKALANANVLHCESVLRWRFFRPTHSHTHFSWASWLPTPCPPSLSHVNIEEAMTDPSQ